MNVRRAVGSDLEAMDESSAPAASWAMAGLALAMLLSSLGTSIANVALPTLAATFEAPFRAVQWIVVVYLLTNTSVIVGVGRLGDLLGPRRLLLVGLALFTAASTACGLAPNLPTLLAARAVQGVGAAVMMALTVALVRATVSRERTGAAMGLLGTMSAVGTALGPSLGGLLVAAAGWRAVFFANVPLGVVALLLGMRHLPRDPARAAADDRARYDTAGAAVLGLTLGAGALAMTAGRDFGAVHAACGGAAVFGAVAFAVVERRAASPLMRLAMLRDGALGAGLSMNLLVSAVMMATLVVGPFYLTRSLGLDVSHAGLVMSVGPLVAAATGVPAGRLVDRIGPHRVMLCGLSGVLLGAGTLATLAGSAATIGYLLSVALMTAGYALFQAANSTAVMTDVAAARRGVVAGLLSLSRNLGLMAGAALLGAVFAAASGATDVTGATPAAIAAAMRVTFAVAAAMVVAALVVGTLGAVRAGRRSES